MNVNGSTILHGILGNPVRHSLSPAMHNRAFTHLGMNRVYLPLPTSDLAGAVAGLRALGFCGASVTVPHKQAIMAHLDELDPVAGRIGAVNTLVIDERGGRPWLRGSNTDWLGANRALSEHLDLAGTTVLVVGAGGSARAVGFGLLEAGARVLIANRTVATGQALAVRLDCPFAPLDGLGSVEADALVNTTSVGMEPKADASVVPAPLLPRFKVVMDIVYAPLETRLLREARAAGCRVVNGLAMLLFQGAAQFELWTGQPAPVAVMREALLEQLRKTG